MKQNKGIRVIDLDIIVGGEGDIIINDRFDTILNFGGAW